MISLALSRLTPLGQVEGAGLCKGFQLDSFGLVPSAMTKPQHMEHTLTSPMILNGKEKQPMMEEDQMHKSISGNNLY